MKMMLSCLMLVLACLPARAQTVFAPAGATWNFGGDNPYWWYHARAFATASIDGKTCAELKFYEHHLGYPPQSRGRNIMCSSGDTVFYATPVGNLRPLYIFNTHGGDTLAFYKTGLTTTSDSFFHVLIDSVKPMNWGGQMLRTVWGRTISPEPDSQDWNGYRYPDTSSGILYVERLGAIAGDGLMPWKSVNIPEYVGSVSCYYDGIVNAPLSTDTCNGIPERIAELAATSISIFPNPVSDFVTIACPSAFPDGTVLTLYDALGRPQRATSPPAGSGQCVLDMSGLPAGMYWLQCSTGVFRPRPLVKE